MRWAIRRKCCASRTCRCPRPAVAKSASVCWRRPINPSDLLFIRGQYGRRPELPATAGFEGAGVVDEAGPGLLGRMRVGRRVAVLHGLGGSWQEYAIVPARQVVPVPRALPDEQAACFFVNPATALIMTRSVLRVSRDRWLLQSAAGSAVGA